MDISDRSSDILRNIVIGRVTEDGSWTEVGRFSDVKTVTFQGEPMPEEFKTKHLRLHNEAFFTAELEPTVAKQIADEICKTTNDSVIDSFYDFLKCTIPRGVSKSTFVLDSAMYCGYLLNEVKKRVISNPAGGFNLLYHPDDTDLLQLCFPRLTLMGLYRMIPTNLVEKGTVYYIPCDEFARVFGYSGYSGLDKALSMFGTQATTTIIDEIPEPQQPVRDISWIRKQMKHCKNPMERKALEKELNEAFKEKKRRRKK